MINFKLRYKEIQTQREKDILYVRSRAYKREKNYETLLRWLDSGNISPLLVRTALKKHKERAPF